MIKMPLVSVVMAAYNAEKYIRDAIDSILDQTFKDFEFIIINDGSIDKTKEIIKSYKDSRIVYLENRKNLGIVAALNKGLEYATGKYIARMDADDISIKERFEYQVKYLEAHSNVVVLGTSYVVFGENIQEKFRICEDDILKAKAQLLFTPSVAHPTVMMRNGILKKYSIKYNKDYQGTEDFAMWWKLANYGEIVSLPNILHYYRIHHTQITSQQANDAKKQVIFRKFVDERFSYFNIILTKEENQIFFNYTCGKSANFSTVEFKLFCNMLELVMKKNQEKKFFEKDALRSVIAKAVEECIFQAPKKRVKFDKWFHYAAERRLVPNYSIFRYIKNMYFM